MKALKSGAALLAMLVAIAASTTSHAAQTDTKGKVLVVMSGAHQGLGRLCLFPNLYLPANIAVPAYALKNSCHGFFVTRGRKKIDGLSLCPKFVPNWQVAAKRHKNSPGAGLIFV